MKRIGRADLLKIWQNLGEEGLNQAAACAGFYRIPEEPPKEKAEKEVEPGFLPAPPPTGETPAEPRVDEAVPGGWFWRVLEYREKEAAETQGEVPAWLDSEIPFEPGEIRADYSQSPPAKVPLVPWSKLWPFLMGVLGRFCDTGTIDMKRVVEGAARLEPVSRLRRKQRLTWAGNCQLILDMGRELMPFWDDEDGLRQHIKKMRGSSGLEVLVFENGPGGWCRRWGKELGELRPYRCPAPGTPILVLSDLNKSFLGGPSPVARDFNKSFCGGSQGGGFLEKSPLDSWQKFGQRLQRLGFRPVVLALCPSRIWSQGMAMVWRLAGWDRGERFPRLGIHQWEGGRAFPGVGEELRLGAEGLLGLLSVAVRVEPALLREVRLMLTRGEADVGTEMAVWNHGDVNASPLAFAIKNQALDYYRGIFETFPLEVREGVVACIRRHHAHLSMAVRAEEERLAKAFFNKSFTGVEGAVFQKSPLGDSFFKRVVKTLLNEGFVQREGMGQWVDRVSGRVPVVVWEEDSVLTAAWLIRNLEAWKQGRVSLPPGLEVGNAAWVFGRMRQPRVWVLRRIGAVFTLDRESWMGEEAVEGWGDRGSPIARITIGLPWVKVRISGGEGRKGVVNEMLNPEAPLPMEIQVPYHGRVTVDSDFEQVIMESFTGPGWAEETRCDRFGLSVVPRDSKEKRRLYWLNPGKYPVFTLDKKKNRQELAAAFFHIKNGCWVEEKEFLDLMHFGIEQPEWADTIGVDAYGVYADFSIKKVVQRMRWIFAGDFKMGSPEDEPERYKNETLHEVLLTRSFWLADTACTQELWQAVMGKNPSRFKGEQRPVEKVSWGDCREFIEKLNGLKKGLHLRLPTEAEWEYACRAGTQTPFWFGENITPDRVNYDGNYPYAGGAKGKYREETVEVKALPCNEWGLYQMHGNVWEWCADWYGDYPVDMVIDPTGPGEGTYRVVRGGGWIGYGRFARSAYRVRSEPSYRFGTGFRLAQVKEDSSRRPEAGGR